MVFQRDREEVSIRQVPYHPAVRRNVDHVRDHGSNSGLVAFDSVIDLRTPDGCPDE
jgi:hypothetical protein